eukprot:4749208-Pleurochrysis_carterae.AAC.1
MRLTLCVHSRVSIISSTGFGRQKPRLLHKPIADARRRGTTMRPKAMASNSQTLGKKGCDYHEQSATAFVSFTVSSSGEQQSILDS